MFYIDTFGVHKTIFISDNLYKVMKHTKLGCFDLKQDIKW